MDEIKMDREIKEMLHQCADELHAPDSMQARVKFALNNAPARKRHLWSKRFVAVAAVAAIAVTGAFAAGGMGGIFSQGWSDQRLDLSSTQAHLADAGVVITLPDKIGEYTFSYGSDVDTTARNDMGETEKVSEVDATYTKDGAELNLSAHKSYTVFTEDEMENPVPATTAEVNGVTLTYRDAHYRFVPDDYRHRLHAGRLAEAACGCVRLGVLKSQRRGSGQNGRCQKRQSQQFCRSRQRCNLRQELFHHRAFLSSCS